MKQPIIIPVTHDGDEAYQVIEDYTFDAGGADEVIARGFICDGASVPRLAWPLMPPDGLHRAAVLPHDWLYAGRGRLRDGGPLTRAECDAIMFRRMVAAGCGIVKSTIVHEAVRLGGWLAWRRSKGQRLILPIHNAGPSIHKMNRHHDGHIYAPS